MLRTILKKIILKNAFLKAINAFLLQIFIGGGIWDGMEIFKISIFLDGWARRDFDGFDAAREHADGKSEVMA